MIRRRKVLRLRRTQRERTDEQDDKRMKFVPDIFDKEAHKEFRRFLENTGQKNWEHKIAKINSLPFFPSPSPNAYMYYLASRNPLISHIETYLGFEREGKVLRKHATPALMKACGYLKLSNALFHQSKPAGFQKLKSILFDDDTARAFLFELDIAVHFFRCGYEVHFVDLQDLETFDLLVSDGQTELEIECKTKSADAGRKITRGNFYLLCDVLTVELAQVRQDFAVLFKCDGRLSGSQELFHAVADEIRKCRVAQRDNGQVDTLGFEIQNLASGLQIRTNEEAAVALAPHWSPHGHYFVMSGRNTLIFGCESTDSDRVLKAIYEDLKRGADQLSKTRPSMLACQIEDLEDDAWEQLRGNTGLAAMTARLLQSPDRNHVNFVVYSSDKTQPKVGGGITSFSATNLSFANKSPKFSIPKSFFGMAKGDEDK